LRSIGLLRVVSTTLLVFLFCVGWAASAWAAPAWIKGEIRLNLRSGAGTEFKIIGAVQTGDELNILSTTKKWTRVQTPDKKTGWIPAGYLENQPPPALRLQLVETEAASLRTQLEELRAETSGLRESNATLTANDSGQRQEIEALKLENYELRAGTRYQEWITGALIVAGGMIVGALLHRRSATRRSAGRIRL
jgi:SH3 domain protein